MKTYLVKAADYSGKPEWKFSVLDRACMDMVIKGTWLFPVRLSEKALSLSLSSLLNHYPQLAGRVKSGEGMECTNAGVPFMVGHDAGVRLMQLPDTVETVKHFSAPLNLRSFKRGEAAPLSVRLTHVEGGSVLGVQCAHVCMDGSAFYKMMDDWGRLCRSVDIELPDIGQPALVPGKDCSKDKLMRRAAEMGWYRVGYRELLQALTMLVTGAMRYRCRPLNLSGEVLNSLVETFNSYHKVHYGRHAILSALITKLSLEAGRVESWRQCSQVSVTDMRGRFTEISRSRVGNIVCNITAEPLHPGDSIFEMATKTETTLKNLFKDGGRAAQQFMQLYIDSIAYKIPYIPFDLAGMNSCRPTAIYINDFLRFGIYELDFGTGRPIAVLPPDLPDQVRIWPSGPGGTGAKIYFSGYLAKLIDKLSDPYAVLNTYMEAYGLRAG